MTQSKIISFFRVLNKPEEVEEPGHEKHASCTDQEDSSIDVKESSEQHCSPESQHVSMSDFEKERLARIEKNRTIMMNKFGLAGACNFLSSAAPSNQKPKRAIRKRKSVHASASEVPRRRSLRHAQGDVVENTVVEEREEKENNPSIFVENSNLLRYVCEYVEGRVENRSDVENATFFKENRMTLFDSKMVRCYSLDYFPKGDLVVGGGKNGHVSVFSCHGMEHDVDPLVSQKLHRGWISDVRLVGDDCPMLLTSGNDGIVALWDLSLREETTHEIKQLSSNDAIHDGGIFSMDYQPLNKTLLTGSKDGRVAITQMDGLKQMTSFDNVHDGHVVKCVKWRSTTDENTFLTAGNDGKTRLHDVRTLNSSKTCFTASSVVNSLLWNPHDINIFLSACNDTIYVHDVRMEGQALASITGHNDAGSSGIYQPLFVNRGKSILTAGSSKSSRLLTLFDIQGKIISQGDVGYSVGASMWCSRRQCAFFSGPRKICPFEPCV